MAEKKKNSGSRGSGGSAGKSASSSGKQGSSGKKKTSGAKGSGAVKKSVAPPKRKNQLLRDRIWAIIIICIGIFMAVSIQTTTTGQFGLVLQSVLKGCFGLAAYILPYYLIVYGILLIAKQTAHISGGTVFLLTVIFLCLVVFNSSRYISTYDLKMSIEFFKDSFNRGNTLTGGGSVGMAIAYALNKYIGITGLYLASSAVLIISVILVADTPLSKFFDRRKQKKLDRLERKYYEAQEADEEAQAEAEPQPQTPVMLMSPQNEDIIIDKKAKKNGRSLRNLFGGSDSDDSEENHNGNETQVSGTDSAANPSGWQQQGEGNASAVSAASGAYQAAATGAGAGLSAGTSSKPAFGDDIASKRIGAAAIFGGTSKMSPSEKKQQIIGYVNEENNMGSAAPEDVAISDFSDLNDFTGMQGTEQTKPGAPDTTFNVGLNVQENSSSSTGKVSISKGQATGKKTEAAADDPLEILLDEIPVKTYRLPPITLLKKAKNTVTRGEELELKTQAAHLEGVLHDFGVNARVVDFKKGPSVTRYEIQPATGVKVSSIVRLADDIALNLKAKSIRIEAPIPGKAAIGIEVQNDSSTMVSLREMIESEEFAKAQSKISFVVGKDISGNCMVSDLKSMPHLLIAGSTGSGKSVCINSMLMSILYKSKPDEVKLVLVDPKVVELGNYNGIPHMLIPVVTDPAKAAAALGWAVQEMNDRYKKFAEMSVRDLASYNEKMKKNDPEKTMPQIVIIIDELADLMMAAARQVEEYICRLAQMARAAGMHLILATQRPSVDIITGVIKANIPSRIAFAVSSGVDSRTILDMVGAEKLVGKGDMLFNPLGMAKPVRLQGPFVSDEEVNAVIEFWKEQAGTAEYATDVISHIENAKVEKDKSVDDMFDEDDDLMNDAIDVVVSAQQASASMLQRRFRIGYNRAARLIDIMEERGIIGQSEGSKPRKVLLTKEEWETGTSLTGAENNEDIH